MHQKLSSSKEKLQEVYRMYFWGSYKLRAVVQEEGVVIHYTKTTYDNHGYTEQRNYFTITR